MIRKLFLIEKSGVCSYYFDLLTTKVDNSCEDFDPQLASGLFSAILCLGDNASTTENSSNLNYISIKNSHFYFMKLDSTLIVVEFDSASNNYKRENIIELMKLIYNLYEEFVTKGIFKRENDLMIEHNSDFDNGIRNYIAKITRRCLFQRQENVLLI